MNYRIMSANKCRGYFETAEEAEKAAKKYSIFVLIEKKSDRDLIMNGEKMDCWDIIGNNEKGILVK